MNEDDEDIRDYTPPTIGECIDEFFEDLFGKPKEQGGAA